MRGLFFLVLMSAPAFGQARVLADRVGTTGFIQLEADSFQKLSPRQQTLAYWLAQAAIAIDPIIYDQNSIWGLRQKRLLEGIVSAIGAAHPKIVAFTKLFWANRGNHEDQTAQKFLPDFTFEELKSAAAEASRKGAYANSLYGLGGLADEAAVNREVGDLRASLFDPNFEPSITAKSPRGNLDILQASANNFYYGVRLGDLANFHETHALNSRVVKSNSGKLAEEVYRAGTADKKIPPGRYALFLEKAIDYLGKARPLAEPGQGAVIDLLIRYYQTGDPADWLRFGAAWVANNPPVDFANGFIESIATRARPKGPPRASSRLPMKS